MLSPQGEVRLWKNLRFLLFLHLMFYIPSKEHDTKPGRRQRKKSAKNPHLENTAHVPPPGEEDSIFIEIPKPKAKETVNLDPNSPNPNSYQSKLPYPERMKVRENDKPSAQHSRFLKMFKQLRLEIGLKEALVEMPKFNKWLSLLLRNKEKLEEIAIMTVNAECSAIIMNKVPEKLEDPGKFLIPCALQELNRTSALANSGASINLLPHSIYKKLELEALTPTRMTLELANRSIILTVGMRGWLFVRVMVYFLGDFVVVNFEPDPISRCRLVENLDKFADELAPLDSLPPDFRLAFHDGVVGSVYLEFSSETRTKYSNQDRTNKFFEASRVRYGYIKNHKKTVKNGQARTQESEEYKAEARKVKPCIIHEGGLALFKCYSWTVWPSFDDKEFILTPHTTITEDTVRSQLQLGDDGGIEDLPIADIYLEGLIGQVTFSMGWYGYVKNHKKSVKKRTRERMSDQEAKEIKAEAKEIMPQPSTVNCS
ncbi:reverse transcriptase domain-containing protein [Tanacetum coccineum]